MHTHLLGNSDHLVERGGDEARKTDDISAALDSLVEDDIAGDHHSNIDDVVVVAAENDTDDVLANVVNVALKT